MSLSGERELEEVTFNEPLVFCITDSVTCVPQHIHLVHINNLHMSVAFMIHNHCKNLCLLSCGSNPLSGPSKMIPTRDNINYTHTFVQGEGVCSHHSLDDVHTYYIWLHEKLVHVYLLSAFTHMYTCSFTIYTNIQVHVCFFLPTSHCYHKHLQSTRVLTDSYILCGALTFTILRVCIHIMPRAVNPHILQLST